MARDEPVAAERESLELRKVLRPEVADANKREGVSIQPRPLCHVDERTKRTWSGLTVLPHGLAHVPERIPVRADAHEVKGRFSPIKDLERSKKKDVVCGANSIRVEEVGRADPVRTQYWPTGAGFPSRRRNTLSRRRRHRGERCRHVLDVQEVADLVAGRASGGDHRSSA